MRVGGAPVVEGLSPVASGCVGALKLGRNPGTEPERGAPKPENAGAGIIATGPTGVQRRRNRCNLRDRGSLSRRCWRVTAGGSLSVGTVR